jgi:hypothetical protein
VSNLGVELEGVLESNLIIFNFVRKTSRNEIWEESLLWVSIVRF